MAEQRLPVSPANDGPAVPDALQSRDSTAAEGDALVRGSHGRPPDESPAAARRYVCPGERHPISRPIHLARLAAFYPACRLCEHRHDTGQLSRATLGRLERTATRAEQSPPACQDGIRGVYLNEFSRRTARELATALAAALWESRPLASRPVPRLPDSAGALLSRPTPPTVVLGHDLRACSPDLCVGVSRALRTMGCELVDVGRVSGPCLSFAVTHLQAAAGIYVTGSGCPSAWAGLDLIGADGASWSSPGSLDEIERRRSHPPARPTRAGGSQRYFDARIPYRASLLKHFQELPALRLSCAVMDPFVADTLADLQAHLPIEWRLHPTFASVADTAPGGHCDVTGDTARTADDAASDWHVEIGDDGRSCRLRTGVGEWLTEATLAETLAQAVSQEGANPRVVVAEDVSDDVRSALNLAGWLLIDGSSASEQVFRQLVHTGAPWGVQSGGRHWFCSGVPSCDAVVTVAKFLKAATRR